jgi:hypothetical protein
MLIKKILDHNYLNGFKFVVAEFGIFILVILPFTFYYSIHKNFLFGIIGIGLLANFVVVIFYAMRSIQRKERSLGINKIYDKKIREQIMLEYPHLVRDTFVLFAALILPFFLATGVSIELLKADKPGNS